jgi:nitronate monooxygenase
MIVEELNHPIALAPLAGGPSTPELTAAVAGTGAFAFLAGGYLTAHALAERMRATRALTDARFGVNVFVPGEPSPRAAIDRYRDEIAGDVTAAGAELGDPRFDDDDWAAKIDLLCADPVPVVSFTFGNPPPVVIDRLRSCGTEIWLTVNSPDEIVAAESAGADVLVVQGTEAGGHQGGPADAGGLGVLPLLQVARRLTGLPLVAAGGLSTGAAVAAVLAAGARCAAIGTAFLRCPEAGTSAVHRAALAAASAPTATTRAFTGRTARGITNRFIAAHSARAPRGYPEIHHLTAPMRRFGRTKGDPDLVNLWAGESYVLGQDLPAAAVVAALVDGARDALAAAAARWGEGQ